MIVRVGTPPATAVTIAGMTGVPGVPVHQTVCPICGPDSLFRMSLPRRVYRRPVGLHPPRPPPNSPPKLLNQAGPSPIALGASSCLLGERGPEKIGRNCEGRDA